MANNFIIKQRPLSMTDTEEELGRLVTPFQGFRFSEFFKFSMSLLTSAPSKFHSIFLMLSPSEFLNLSLKMADQQEMRRKLELC